MACFEDLQVWRRSLELVVEICKHFGTCSNFSLKDQITRSALSVPSNIAEGAERLSKKEFIQFLAYAKGSAGELRTQLIIATKLDYVSANDSEKWISELREISAMICGLINSQRK